MLCHLDFKQRKRISRNYILREIYYKIVGTGKASLKSAGQATRKDRLGIWIQDEIAVHRQNFFFREALLSSLRSWGAGGQQLIPEKYGDSGSAKLHMN